MTALLLIRRGGDIVGQCDAKCYEAKHSVCTCVCEAANHQVGREQAVINTRAMAEGWVAKARTEGQEIDSYELDLSAQHEPLFPLPQETDMDARTQARAERIAEDTAQLIDYTSRVLGAVENGNWHYAADKIRGLRDALDSLERHLDGDDPNQHGSLRLIDGATVWATVAEQARHYWLGRAIFGGERAGRT